MRGILLLLILLCMPSTVVLSQSNNSISTAIGGIETDTGYWVVVQTQVPLEDEYQYFQDLIFVDLDGEIQISNQIYETENSVRVNAIHLYENGDLLILIEENEYGIVLQQTDILLKVSASGDLIASKVGGDFSVAGRFRIVTDEQNKPEIASVFEDITLIYTIEDDLETDLKYILPNGGRTGDLITSFDILSNETHYIILSYIVALDRYVIFLEEYSLELPSTSSSLDFDLEGEPIGFIETDDYGYVILGLSFNRTKILVHGVHTKFQSNPVILDTISQNQRTSSIIEINQGFMVFGRTGTEGEYFFNRISSNGENLGYLTIGVGEDDTQLMTQSIAANGGILALGMLNNQSQLIKIDDQNQIQWYVFYSGEVNRTTSVRTRITFFFPILLIPILAKPKLSRKQHNFS